MMHTAQQRQTKCLMEVELHLPHHRHCNTPQETMVVLRALESVGLRASELAELQALELVVLRASESVGLRASESVVLRASELVGQWELVLPEPQGWESQQ